MLKRLNALWKSTMRETLSEGEPETRREKVFGIQEFVMKYLLRIVGLDCRFDVYQR